MLVQTIKGLIEMELMDVRDVVEVFDNCRKITTEYRFNGELVKCDIAASMLRGPSSDSTAGQMN